MGERKEPPDLSGYEFGKVKPKEPEATPKENKPLTAWDIAGGVFAGLSFFYFALRLFG